MPVSIARGARAAAPLLRGLRLAMGLGALLTGGCLTPPLAALPSTSILVENFLDGETPADAALLDHDGITPLDAGTAADGDGAAIALGYFAGGDPAAPFSGTWIPLTGPRAANPALPPTSIGDHASNVAGPYGFFQVLVEFDQASPQSVQDIPEPGTRLAVAIYNGPTPSTSTHFNIATNDAWRWTAPSLVPEILTINLNAPGTQWHGGPETARIAAVPLAEFPGTILPARLVNLSTRAFVGAGDQALMPGFVLRGSETKKVLVRAAGPALASFGVDAFVPNPILRIVETTTGREVASNDDWLSQPDPTALHDAIAQVGAFPFVIDEDTPSPLDAAVLAELPPIDGGYTVQIADTGGNTGIVIAEIYLLDTTPGTTRLDNISTRGLVGSGESLMIPGFTLGDGTSRRLLIRAAGPALAAVSDLSGTLPDPVLKVFRILGPDESILVAENTNWEDHGQAAAISEANHTVGAFDLVPGGRDAALILEAQPSTNYTVQVESETGTTGIVLAEIYVLP